MNPLSFIYGVGISSKNALYDRGLLRSWNLEGPVVSVGNLSVGGAGKTPFVLLLGKLLQAHGMKFDILSRGYGRTASEIALVDPGGTAAEFGDEPLLIAQQLRVPVVVGARRYEAGRYAEAKFGPQLHLLDDGFQHRKLARDFDIVLLTQQDFDDCLLPVGRLREPLQSINRADAVVLMGNVDIGTLPLKNQSVWQVSRGVALQDVPSRPVVFCGIARPDAFIRQLNEVGVEPAAHKFFRDHHSYTNEDIDKLRKLQQQSRADGFLTTEKDVINLAKFMPALGPLSIARVTMELNDADNAVNTILRRVAEHRPQS